MVSQSMHFQITAFKGEYRFLSNFYMCELEWDGRTWPSVEHAFQAAKTNDSSEQEDIQRASTASEAKRLGRSCTLRPDWEHIRNGVMYQLLTSKFKDPDLQERLLATGEAKLIEGNTWGDTYWGKVKKGDRWVGQNWLGKLLMKVRDELQTL